jgi:hypothetical protein
MLCIKLEINQGYTTMHGQPIIKIILCSWSDAQYKRSKPVNKFRRKSAKVISIPKFGKPPSDPGSHRPISLLSTFSKLPERVEVHRLNSVIHQNHILLPEQFGFCKQQSTVCQIARITDCITHGSNIKSHRYDPTGYWESLRYSIAKWPTLLTSFTLLAGLSSFLP